MNKKIIFSLCLLVPTLSHGMERNKNLESDFYSWNIFGYLNWHESPASEHLKNNFMCKQVERLVNQGIDVNKREINMMSRFCGMTPLEVAISESKCTRCITLLKQHGAQETEYSRFLEKNTDK